MYLVLVDLLDMHQLDLVDYKIISHPVPILKKKNKFYLIKSFILLTLGQLSCV
jgi:hypothetical protein